MATFSARDADQILKHLGATVRHSDHIVGLVQITPNHRIRLFRSAQRGDQPSFVYNKWKQALRLNDDEMRRLIKGRLKAPEVIALIRERLGL